MSVWVTLEMNVKAGAMEALHQFLYDKLPAVRGFEGAMSVTVFFAEDEEGLLIQEEWRSKAHHEAYIRTISQNGVMAELVDFMVAPPKVTYFARAAL